MNQWKKSGVLVLVMCMLLSVPYSGWLSSVGSLHAAGNFEDGDGSKDDPYRITSAEELNEIRNMTVTEATYFELMNDIDLSTHPDTSEWEPIEDFAGNLDGAGKVISNLKMDSTMDEVGLFANLLPGARIENMSIADAEVPGGWQTGILAGRSEGSTIHNVTVSGTIKSNGSRMGGLIGSALDSTISASNAKVDLTDGGSEIGGLIGYADESIISNSHAKGNVSGSYYIGGLIGSVTNVEISESYATGEVRGRVDIGGLAGLFTSGEISFSFATGDVFGCEDVGGLIGDNDGFNTNNYATGNVTGPETCRGDSKSIGGLVGDNREGITENSYATGLVTGFRKVGGLVGDNAREGRITNSYAIGSVTGVRYVGGLVGDNEREGIITNSYAVGLVTANENEIVGGLVGNNIDDNNIEGEITNSYYDKDLSNQSDDKGQGLTSEEMKNSENYDDSWEFGTIWGLGQHHDGYPYLIEMESMQAFLTYSGNGANNESEIFESKLYRTGSLVTIREGLDMSRTGYDFHGWNTASDGSGDSYEGGSSIELNKHLLLYANWQPIQSDNADLASLTIIAEDDELALSPAFSAEEISYQAETISSEVTIRTTPSDERAAVSLDGDELNEEKKVALVEGDNLLELVVTAENGAIKTYHLTIHREVESEEGEEDPTPPGNQEDSEFTWIQSGNANLANLSVTIDGEELVLSPKFTAGETNYQAETMANEALIKVTPSNARATVFLEAERIVGEEKVVLEEGDNAFELIVRAENGTSKPYRLTIHRIATPEEVEAPICTFSDMKGHWAESFICEAFERGIVNGHTETMFSPDSGITRVEFASMMLRTLGMTSSASSVFELSFVDQDQIPTWAANAVRIAVENGILHGYPDQSLRPLDNVSRAEMVAMMARALEWEISTGDTAFHDDGDIPNWSKGYIREAVDRGLLVGRGNNLFIPSDSATRAEATVMLLRLWHALDVLHSETAE